MNNNNGSLVVGTIPDQPKVQSSLTVYKVFQFFPAKLITMFDGYKGNRKIEKDIIYLE